MSRESLFNDAVASSPAFSPINMANRSEIVEYYKETYGAGWRSEIVNKIQEMNPDAKRASIAREFQFDKRIGAERYTSNKMTAATRERYEKLGAVLPPKGHELKQDTITVVVKGQQAMGPGGGHREKTVKVTLSGAAAKEFAATGNYDYIWEAYDVPVDLFDEGGDYELVVGSVSIY